MSINKIPLMGVMSILVLLLCCVIAAKGDVATGVSAPLTITTERPNFVAVPIVNLTLQGADGNPIYGLPSNFGGIFVVPTTGMAKNPYSLRLDFQVSGNGIKIDKKKDILDTDVQNVFYSFGGGLTPLEKTSDGWSAVIPLDGVTAGSRTLLFFAQVKGMRERVKLWFFCISAKDGEDRPAMTINIPFVPMDGGRDGYNKNPQDTLQWRNAVAGYILRQGIIPLIPLTREELEGRSSRVTKSAALDPPTPAPQAQVPVKQAPVAREVPQPIERGGVTRPVSPQPMMDPEMSIQEPSGPRWSIRRRGEEIQVSALSGVFWISIPGMQLADGDGKLHGKIVVSPENGGRKEIIIHAGNKQLDLIFSFHSPTGEVVKKSFLVKGEVFNYTSPDGGEK
jgi:hypothetical protein